MVIKHLIQKIIKYLTISRYEIVIKAINTKDKKKKEDLFKCAADTTKIINYYKKYDK